MTTIGEYVLVFLGAAVPLLEMVLVIPAGIAAGLSPVPVGIVAFAGNLSTVVAVIYGLDEVLRRRARRSGRRARRPERRSVMRARRLVERVGVPGLALVAPVTTGAHIAAAVALGLGGSRRSVTVWMSVGLAVWAVVAVVVSVAGVSFIGIG
ncbi:MAG: small multi-drug export protein [Acidimicrobiales bacterium]